MNDVLKMSGFFYPHPPCYEQKSGDFVPLNCFSETPSPISSERKYGLAGSTLWRRSFWSKGFFSPKLPKYSFTALRLFTNHPSADITYVKAPKLTQPEKVLHHRLYCAQTDRDLGDQARRSGYNLRGNVC